MRTFDAAATHAALPFERLVPALRERFAAGATVPPRHVHAFAGVGTPEVATSLIMPAWLEGRYYGVKVINIAPGNAARGLPGLHASYLLFDGATGAPLALIDGDALTARRTAAASALAASFLARDDATRLVVVGAGRIAALLPQAYRVVRPIDDVRIWARRPSEAARLAEALRDRAAQPADDLEAAVRQADIVCCATLATTPVIEGRWLRPGSHLDLIGSFTPAMREADDACLAGAALYVDIDEAFGKSGDLIGPLARGVVRDADRRGTLEALCRGTADGRRDAAERTVFKAVGTALADLAAAILVFESDAALTSLESSP